MTAALNDQPVGTTSVEDVIACATAPLSRTGARAATLSLAGSRPRSAERGTSAPPRRAPSGRPSELRARLLPAGGGASPAQAEGPAHGTAVHVQQRITVMRSSDRALVLECADEERGDLPIAEPGVVVRRLALAAVEVIAGLRPAAQLARWLTPGVLQAVRVRADLHRRATSAAGRATAGSRPPVVRSTHVCRVEERVVEAAVVVDDGCRVRAVAVRLETHRGMWRATALDVG